MKVRVNTLIVCVVPPWRTSATFTGMVDGLDLVVAVITTAGVPVGVALADGVPVFLGVAVALGVPVAVAVPVALGVGVELGGPFVGSEVLGNLLSTLRISLMLGVTPGWNFVTVKTVTVF